MISTRCSGLAYRQVSSETPRPPSARMLQATRMLSVLDCQRDFHHLIDAGLATFGVSRPPEAADALGRTDDPSTPVAQPPDLGRQPGDRAFLSAPSLRRIGESSPQEFKSGAINAQGASRQGRLNGGLRNCGPGVDAFHRVFRGAGNLRLLGRVARLRFQRARRLAGLCSRCRAGVHARPALDGRFQPAGRNSARVVSL
jgi:hypothetical protein